ncbi:MAG: DUF211 domain-containing protein [Candidatus Bathyarchaeota archaeon]|nr:DUF211 domain-containing protein [Candidatus Bathyarchaeota archaeon]
MPVSIKRIVVDSLKPRETPIIELSKALCYVDGVEEVDVAVTEVDAKTETIRLTIKGSDINYENIVKVLSEYGVAVRSIDEINVSKKIAKTHNS